MSICVIYIFSLINCRHCYLFLLYIIQRRLLSTPIYICKVTNNDMKSYESNTLLPFQTNLDYCFFQSFNLLPQSFFFHLLFVLSFSLFFLSFNLMCTLALHQRAHPHLIIVLVNILGTRYECERSTIHTYRREKKLILCNPFLFVNCLMCMCVCSKHISSFLLPYRTLELEHSLFFTIILYIHFSKISYS